MKRNSLGVPEKGFTLVEIMVALSLLLVVAIPVPAIFSVAAKTQQVNQAKNIAANIATQELEQIRNLSYEDGGTDPGNPGGSLSKADDITVETIRFRIERRVVWVDDAFDGQEPNDPLPADYKRATVVVSSIDMPSMTPVAAATLVSRRGEETMSSRGNIRVHVLGADEEPIRGVRVDVGRGSAAPFRDRTNSSGRVLFPALRPSDAGDDYEIGASKGNYVSLEPQPLRATVTSGNTTHVYVHLDLPGHLIAHVVDAENNPIQDSQISLARADSEP
ncbi:MAG: prepilin-type N-terminal cleavage/methylation domain-containing protein, partial [Terriglobia bacterium]